MKACSAGFKTMLATSQSLFMADLYTITLGSGSVFYYTGAPQNITIGGHAYLAGASGVAPGFSRGPTKQSIGLADESLDVDLVFDAATLINNLTPGAFANAGGFDGALIQVDKFLTPSLSDVSRGTVNLFSGVITDVEAGSTRVTLHCTSSLVYLNSQFPRNYFLPSCNHALFDAGCGIAKTSWVVSAAAVTSSTATVVTCSALAQASGYFALGYIIVKTGANAGLVRTVRGFASGALTLLYPLPVACTAGDTIDVYPGCDKTVGANGCAKFSNLPHFRGFPYVPTPELIAMGGSSGAPIDNSGPGAGVSGIGRGTGGQPGNFRQQ